jgi:hypothetical protein
MKYPALIATIRTITGQVAPNASNSGTSNTPRTATSTSDPAARLGSDATPCSRRRRRKVDLVANAAAVDAPLDVPVGIPAGSGPSSTVTL